MLIAPVVGLFIFAADAREPAPPPGARLAIFATGDTGDTDTDTDGYTDAYTDLDTDADTDADSDSDTDADTDSDSDTDTTGEDTWDTGACLECSSAAELAGEVGGAPCATGGLAAFGSVWIPIAFLARRRRR